MTGLNGEINQLHSHRVQGSVAAGNLLSRLNCSVGEKIRDSSRSENLGGLPEAHNQGRRYEVGFVFSREL